MTGARRFLSGGDLLPLTCTRAGTCCHGKDIRITPWELARLAAAAGLTPADFRDRYTADGGTRLAMSGAPGWRGLRACALYDPAAGCRVHAVRPLACRLYPLGREVRAGGARIMHEGRRFPCLDGCPDVATLPQQTVADYLSGQGVDAWAPGRDAYLEIAQDAAEAAFVLVFDSGLSRHPGADWLPRWRGVTRGGAGDQVAALGRRWHDRFIVPTGMDGVEDGAAWAAAHAVAIQNAAQAEFAVLSDPGALAAASATMLAGAMLLVHAVGGDADDVGRRWLAAAAARR